MTKTVKLGLKENWKQFTLLVIINAFVGGMVGIERSILPQLAEHDFGMMAIAMGFGFIFSLPYNYYQLQKTGKICHEK